MSAIFDAQTKWLSGTLTATVPTVEQNVLVAVWFKTSGLSHSGVMAEIRSADVRNYMCVKGNSSNKEESDGNHGAALIDVAQVSAFAFDTWRLAGGLLPPDDDGFNGVKAWDNGTSRSVTMDTPNTETGTMPEIYIGQGLNFNEFSNWVGRLAEVSFWIVGSEAEADTIMSDLATATADAVTPPAGSTLLAYYPLTADATATTGPALTNHGTVTFDNTDNPSLSGGGGGGGSNLLLKLQEHGAFL